MFYSKYISGVAMGAILFTGLLFLSSCEKFVEIDDPVNTIGTEAVFNSDEKALSALSGMYSLMINEAEMKATNGAQSVYGALLSDEGLFGLNPGLDDLYELYNAQILKKNGMVITLWDKPYQVIYAANAIEAGVNNSTSLALSNSTRNQILGEAKLVRAFLYFNLVNTFGEIPLVLTTDVNVNKSMTKSSVAAVNNQIEKDLRDAFSLLNNDYSHAGGKKLRPNKYAAAALLARQYLYMQRWDESAAFADTVINSGKYSLTTVANTFKAENAEALWQLQNSRIGVVESFEASYFVPPFRFSEDPISLGPIYFDLGLFQMSADFGYIFPLVMASDHIINSFDKKDLRMKTWMDSIPTPIEPPYNGKVNRFFFKYNRESYLFGTKGNLNNTVLRLAEMYLVRAEAIARGSSSLSDAVDDINIIRRRAGLDDISIGSQQDVLDAIEKERKHELFAEWSHRWFDVKRWGKADTVFGTLSHKQPWSNHTLVLPIPESEIMANPRLLQNPGYTK